MYLCIFIESLQVLMLTVLCRSGLSKHALFNDIGILNKLRKYIAAGRYDDELN